MHSTKILYKKVSIGMKCLYVIHWVYYVLLVASAIVVVLLSPVEDKNKPLDKIEQSVYRIRSWFVISIEIIIVVIFDVVNLANCSSL